MATAEHISNSNDESKKDWSAAQYLKFNNDRTRPVYDLVSQIVPHVSCSQPRMYDLGCGPGNSTKVLHDAFPTARITGMDSSPDMLRRARADFQGTPNVDFVPGDLTSYQAEADAHVLFSNAVFHWLRCTERMPTLVRLLQGLSPGGVLALQMPDNYDEPSHALMRLVATMPSQPWSKYFASTRVGHVADAGRPDLDAVEAPAAFYNALVPYASSVNVWRTQFHHVLKDAAAIVEWVKGTGLLPYLNRIEHEDAKKAFLAEYQGRLKEAYPEMSDGNVLLVYPRLFIVAVRK
ncbi:hypothetical protein ACJQWK_06167 [Exserohilum turcicum]|uniref:Methyltransferase domain-containing protein n=1 Tax=Exserohilum turcicum (strain 28A) TaxID=671987 RepID=R0KHK0_EXST2|nr:uncharacterized protein SETTUDRAFT_106814 [Exserohilum turcica Et28A]EOA88694.1 hypothetical protein SETTUDRAFT_106814 [Exserohilum turcica Et28A]